MASAVSVNLSLRSPRGSNSSSSKSRTIKLKKAFKTILSSSNNKHVDVNSNHEIATIRYSETHKKKPSYSVFQTAAEKPLQAAAPATEDDRVSIPREGQSCDKKLNKDMSSANIKLDRKHSKRKDHTSEIKWVVPDSDVVVEEKNINTYAKIHEGGDGNLPLRDFKHDTPELHQHQPNRRERNPSPKKRTVNSPRRYSGKRNSRSARLKRRNITNNTRQQDQTKDSEHEQEQDKENLTETLDRSPSKWQRQYYLLETEKQHLEDQFHNLKLKLQRQQTRGAVNSKIQSLVKENTNLKDDMEVLKSVVRRLNKEIRSYQDKLKSCVPQSKRIPVYVSSANSSNTENDDQVQARKDVGGHEDDEYWFRNCRTKLQPLLIAYDEIIKEKDEIVKDYEIALEHFKQRTQEIIRENEALHKTVVDGKQKGSISMEDWQYLSDNATVVLEENDLLHEQVEVLKRKFVHLQKANDERESKLKLQISIVEEDRSKVLAVKNQLETHCKLLAEQLTKLSQNLQSRIPMEEHEKSVAECKRLFEELKRNYEEDRKILNEKLDTAINEKSQLHNQMSDIETEKLNLQSEVQALQAAVGDHHSKLNDMYSKMEEASKAKEATAVTVAEMMKLAKAMVQDRDSLEKSLKDQKMLNYRIMNLRSQESGLVSQLKEKIQTLEANHQMEVQSLLKKMSEYESTLNVERSRYDAEQQRLHSLVERIERDNDVLLAEKKQLQADLETVWRASTSHTTLQPKSITK